MENSGRLLLNQGIEYWSEVYTLRIISRKKSFGRDEFTKQMCRLNDCNKEKSLNTVCAQTLEKQV